MKTKTVALAGVIAAAYAGFTLLTITLLQGLAWGPVQLRISEALTVLPVLTGAAVPGLAIGCIIGNTAGALLTGGSILSILDVAFGTIATTLGALWTRRFREKPLLALAGPVIANALIVPAYLPVILESFGLSEVLSYYTIPFTSISLGNSYLAMYLFGVVAIGIGEAIVVYALGYPLLLALRRLHIFE